MRGLGLGSVGSALTDIDWKNVYWKLQRVLQAPAEEEVEEEEKNLFNATWRDAEEVKVLQMCKRERESWRQTVNAISVRPVHTHYELERKKLFSHTFDHFLNLVYSNLRPFSSQSFPPSSPSSPRFSLFLNPQLLLYSASAEANMLSYAAVRGEEAMPSSGEVDVRLSLLALLEGVW